MHETSTAQRNTHQADALPFEGWAPCFFEPPPSSPALDAPVPENPLAVVRRTVAVDLANQLIFSSIYKRLLWRDLDPEFCEKVGTDDGDGFWCECTPCRSTNSIDGTAVVFKGTVILPSQIAFVDSHHNRTHLSWFSQKFADISLQRESALQILRPNFSALRIVGIDADPTAENFIDRMALRGVIHDPARLSVHTRRILVFLNEAATLLTTSPESGFILPEHNLLTFLTYQDYTAPPIFEEDPTLDPDLFYPGITLGDFLANPRDAGRVVLHPALTPMISGSRDLFEYDSKRVEQSRPRVDSADETVSRRPLDYLAMPYFEQHRIAPERFNLVRWSRIARQTGFYEWMYGRNSLVPRIYSGRLQNALRDGYDVARARVFLAEAEPHLGLDGIKFYEAARLLWDRNASVEQVRDEYCEALFGGVGTPVGHAMRQYFEALERIWCGRDKIERISRPGTPTRVGDPPQQRLASGFNLGTFGGYGACGCLGWISELDPYMRSTADVIAHRVPEESAMPFFAADGPWTFVQDAYRMAPSGTPLRQRVQFFRCAIGLTGLLIRLYRPVLEMWMQVERHFESEFNPLDWTRMHEMGTMVALGQLGARAAAAVPADVRGALGTALNNVEWVTAVGFRRSMRDRVHSYIAGIGTVAGLGGELGLGLSRVPYVSGGTNRIEFGSQQTPEGALRSAFYLRYISDYITWWNNHGLQNIRGLEHQSDDGMGVSMFSNMKEVIAAMMVLSSMSDGVSMFPAQNIVEFVRNA